MAAALVSVVTRSQGRPSLADAAVSVAAQAYRPIEWIVVDASGRGIDAPSAGDVEVRVVGEGEPLRRARAANVGLRHARGARALILDDDDLLSPNAIARLAATLDGDTTVRAAYGDVLVETRPGVRPAVFRFEYSPLQLHLRNLFPPHAVLFDLSLVRADRVAFDERLDWFEDWDFWLGVSAHTAFAHVHETVGVYRMHLSTSGIWMGDKADPRIREACDAVIARHAARTASLRRALQATKAEARRLEHAGDHAAAARAWETARMMLPTDEEALQGRERTAGTPPR